MREESSSFDLLSIGLSRSFVLRRCCVLYWVTEILGRAVFAVL